MKSGRFFLKLLAALGLAAAAPAAGEENRPATAPAPAGPVSAV